MLIPCSFNKCCLAPAVSQACVLHVTSFVRLHLSWSLAQICSVSFSIPVFLSDETDAEGGVTQEVSVRVGIRNRSFGWKSFAPSVLSRNLSSLLLYSVEILILNVTCAKGSLGNCQNQELHIQFLNQGLRNVQIK